MTISIYETCLAAKFKQSADLRLLLQDINFNIFNVIFQKFNNEEPFFIIMFILQAYSEESPWLILGSDWIEEKNDIAERLQVPDYMRPWLVDLVDEQIRCVVVDYLDYQCRPLFKLLQFKQMQYSKISSIMLKQMQTDADGKMDTKEMFEASKELDKLQTAIAKLEEDIKKRYQFVYIGKEEAIKADSKTSNKWKGNIESSKFINKEFNIAKAHKEE